MTSVVTGLGQGLDGVEAYEVRFWQSWSSDHCCDRVGAGLGRSCDRVGTELG